MLGALSCSGISGLLPSHAIRRHETHLSLLDVCLMLADHGCLLTTGCWTRVTRPTPHSRYKQRLAGR